MRPVYLINGFLESGKTQFIKFTIAQPYFQIKGRTLLILCEEGEEEYEDNVLKAANTVVKLIEDEEDFTTEKLMALEREVDPERIIIEYNGMWNMKNLALPFHWNLEQQITCVDASTFETYYTNMKSLLAEMIRKSELIIFNRCDNVMDNLAVYRRNIKAVNSSADVIFENAQGEINQIFEEDLPYDLKADKIVLDERTFGIWYLDTMDHAERYEGKILEFDAMVLKPKTFPRGYFVPGRLAMTCCADDMQFLGYACEYKDADKLKDREWIRITARVNKEFFSDYQAEGPVLHAVSVKKTQKPKNEIVGFG